MKPGAKRRRSKAQIAAEKKQAELKEVEIAAKLAQFDQMQTQVAKMEGLLADARVMHHPISERFEAGELKQGPDGSILVVDDPGERESIRSAHGSKSRYEIGNAPVIDKRRARDFDGGSRSEADIDIGFE